MVQPLLSKSSQNDDKPLQQLNERELEAESSLKPGEETLSAHRGAIRVPSPHLSLISIDDSNNIRLGQNPDCAPLNQERYASRSLTTPRTLKGKIQASWTSNKGLALVLLSQFFWKLDERHYKNTGNGRMSITMTCSCFYMWYKKTEHFPFGMKEVRSLLVARGLFGFFGVFGMYYSLMYLPLADATVITFLAPSLACWACSYFIHEPFTRMEQIAAYVSLFGVVLIARPVTLFSALSHSDEPVLPATGDLDTLPLNTTASSPDRLAADYDAVTPTQRAMAVGIAMLGVIGAAGAYTTIRWIGKRAHPLISVNYFATWCTIVSVVAMFTIPGIGFLLPNSLKDWCYLIFLGICGFVMQFLLAAGLQYEKSSRATNMVYMQMLFALAFDKLVWGTTPGVLSIIGSSLILGSAIYVAMNKEDPRKIPEPIERGDGEEERGLISPAFDSGRRDDEDADMQMMPLR